MEPSKHEQQLNYALKKNKPRLLFPILNTVFAVAISAFLTVVAIKQKQPVWVYFVILFFLVIYPLSSWYNGYFSKKDAWKRIYNVQEEAQQMLEYSKHLIRRTKYQLTEESHLDFLANYADSASNQKVTFNEKTKEFEPLSIVKNKKLALLTIGLSFAGVGIDPATKEVKGIMGMVPCSIWIKKKLTPPIAKPGSVSVDFKDYAVDDEVIFQYRQKEDIYYDPKSGWLCFGTRKTTQIDEAVKIADDAILVIRNQDLVSIWVKASENIAFR